MRKSAGKSDPVWADEMGDGWGGVRDKSQRGLGLWEPLLLWSVKSTGSQWSTWPLRCAYSSKSACEAWQDNVSNPLQHGDPRPQVHSPADRCLTELTSAFFKHLYKSEIKASDTNMSGEHKHESCESKMCPKAFTTYFPMCCLQHCSHCFIKVCEQLWANGTTIELPQTYTYCDKVDERLKYSPLVPELFAHYSLYIFIRYDLLLSK